MIGQLISLPKIVDNRGNLSFLENNNQLPFQIERVYWTYDVPGGEKRGGHAFKIQAELIIALSGSFDVVLNNGHEEMKYHLNRSYFGLYLPPMIWRHLENFSTNSVALVATNTQYDQQDYVRDFEQFKQLVNEGTASNRI